MLTIDKAQLKKWLDRGEDVLLVNVLPTEDFVKQHIPGSISIPYKDNPHFVQQVLGRAVSKDQHLVIYCAGKECDLSKQAARALLHAHFTNVQVFEEGVAGWFSKHHHAAA